jgi:soluble lytic murein transglycosylase
MDLFLETIPFAETRDYGRKVLSAAVMYGWLYYGKTPGDVINEILGQGKKS